MENKKSKFNSELCVGNSMKSQKVSLPQELCGEK